MVGDYFDRHMLTARHSSLFVFIAMWGEVYIMAGICLLKPELLVSFF